MYARAIRHRHHHTARAAAKNATVAATTIANGGDNIGVYTPVFLSVEPLAVVAYCIIFLALVARAAATSAAARAAAAEVHSGVTRPGSFSA